MIGEVKQKELVELPRGYRKQPHIMDTCISRDVTELTLDTCESTTPKNDMFSNRQVVIFSDYLMKVQWPLCLYSATCTHLVINTIHTEMCWPCVHVIALVSTLVACSMLNSLFTGCAERSYL